MGLGWRLNRILAKQKAQADKLQTQIKNLTTHEIRRATKQYSKLVVLGRRLAIRLTEKLDKEKSG